MRKKSNFKALFSPRETQLAKKLLDPMDMPL